MCILSIQVKQIFQYYFFIICLSNIPFHQKLLLSNVTNSLATLIQREAETSKIMKPHYVALWRRYEKRNGFTQEIVFGSTITSTHLYKIKTLIPFAVRAAFNYYFLVVSGACTDQKSSLEALLLNDRYEERKMIERAQYKNQSFILVSIHLFESF